MLGRILFMGTVLIATAPSGAQPVFAASGGLGDDADAGPRRMRLSCTGAMSTDGRETPDRNDPASRIVADGMIDRATMQVMGFGLGAARIVVVTPAMIGFGEAGVDRLAAAAVKVPRAPSDASGTIVQGSIDRVTGATSIVVRSARDPGHILIAMALDCRMEPAPG